VLLEQPSQFGARVSLVLDQIASPSLDQARRLRFSAANPRSSLRTELSGLSSERKMSRPADRSMTFDARILQLLGGGADAAGSFVSTSNRSVQ
jgi:hypothetical protein